MQESFPPSSISDFRAPWLPPFARAQFSIVGDAFERESSMAPMHGLARAALRFGLHRFQQVPGGRPVLDVAASLALERYADAFSLQVGSGVHAVAPDAIPSRSICHSVSFFQGERRKSLARRSPKWNASQPPHFSSKGCRHFGLEAAVFRPCQALQLGVVFPPRARRYPPRDGIKATPRRTRTKGAGAFRRTARAQLRILRRAHACL